MNIEAKTIVTVIELAVFLALLGSSYCFVNSVVREYLEGNTHFKLSKESVTSKDMPTATVCFLTKTKMELGQDFQVSTLAWAENNIYSEPTLLDLQRGHNEYFSLDFNRFINLKQLVVQQTISFLNRSCVSMELGLEDNFGMRSDRNSAHYIGLFMIHISSNSDTPDDVRDIDKGLLYLTSAENSYGAITYRWLDGQVNPFQLEKGSYHGLMVNQIKRFEYMAGTCSEKSYFGCWSSNLNVSATCRENGHTCSPYTLPNISTDMPICVRNQTVEVCRKELESRCKGQRSCLVQEYVMERNNLWSRGQSISSSSTEGILQGYLSGDILKTLLEKQNMTFMFFLIFDSPGGSRGSWVDELRVRSLLHIHSQTYLLILERNLTS